MKNIKAFIVVALVFALTIVGCTQADLQSDGSKPSVASSVVASASEILLRSDVDWTPLNPARGDQSPKAATLWGDRAEAGPSGFLVQFADGFSSPPHIHNVTYKGMVISGLVHNDDPDAEDMWLPAGSFWTQPAGEVHITSADASDNVAYIEIEDGPYLVLPEDEAFDNGERPVNVEQSNLVWLDASNITWIEQPGAPDSTNGPKLAFLWGAPEDNQLNGTLVTLPTGFTGDLRSSGSTLRAVVIQGKTNYQQSDEATAADLEPGSYFGSEGDAVHKLSCKADEDCVIYLRAEGKYDLIPS